VLDIERAFWRKSKQGVVVGREKLNGEKWGSEGGYVESRGIETRADE
jgi:hypothetical protein